MNQMKSSLMNTPLKNIYTKPSFRQIWLIEFLMTVTLIMIVPSFYKTDLTDISTGFIFTNFIIGAISIVMIVVETKKMHFSLHVIHWVFQFTFFFIAPVIQYLNNHFIWGLLSSSNTSLLIKSNLLVLLWQIVWIITSKLTSKRQSDRPVLEKPYPNIIISPFKILLMLVLSVIFLFYFIHVYGVSGLFARGATKGDAIINNSSLLMIIFTFGRSLPVVLLVCAFHKYKLGINRTLWMLLILIASVLVVVLNFPSATQRFWAATVYLGIIITFFHFKSRNTLVYMLIFGLLIVFPTLGFSRNASNFKEFVNKFDINGLYSNNILTGDYDAFSVINYTVQFIQLNGSTLGKQLLGVLFFFIPRTYWETKPIGSGSTVSANLGLTFDNISSTPIAEGLINFGVLGVILFAAVFSFLTKKYDLLYWFSSQGSEVLKVLYPFMIGLFFFMMRGDLLSTFSFMVSFSIAFFVFLRNPKSKKLPRS